MRMWHAFRQSRDIGDPVSSARAACEDLRQDLEHGAAGIPLHSRKVTNSVRHTSTATQCELTDSQRSFASLLLGHRVQLECLDLKLDGTQGVLQRATIREWFEHVAIRNFRNLRLFKLNITKGCSIEIKFSEADGVAAHFDTRRDYNILWEGYRLLEEHVAAIEDTRKALNLEGESIIVVLLVCPDLMQRLAEQVTSE